MTGFGLLKVGKKNIWGKTASALKNSNHKELKVERMGVGQVSLEVVRGQGHRTRQFSVCTWLP